ncbi:lytic transglycosylase domain-containing protein [Pseudonocardia sp. MH-G8]|uniref:lytic transglycosylase domain-containing protein n=1 Tax=Pseudonocardia sp. MH-G8 TaxID=1854588 RepID=UPI001E48776A|nr:lytic murein transglycosylase [Pseudonocardia sp. MH-G8]
MTAPDRRRPRRAGPIVLAVLGVMAMLVVVGVAALSSLSAPDDGADEPRRGDGLTPADVDRNTPVPQPAPLAEGIDLAAWSGAAQERSGVPARALRAYAAAELGQRADTPDCGLSWITLAGIGRVESDHGRYGGAEVDADGVARPRIIGVPLDGSPGVREIRDTDTGRFDGDTTFDRAVGPMQFLPGTWERYGADGNADGVRDPHQLDDAALAAARYLCADGRDTASGEGWWDGILTYNSSVEYARLVWAAADRYNTTTAA